MKVATKWHQFIACDITDLLDGSSDENRHRMAFFVLILLWWRKMIILPYMSLCIVSIITSQNRGICRCYRNICSRPMRLHKTVPELACMIRLFHNYCARPDKTAREGIWSFCSHFSVQPSSQNIGACFSIRDLRVCPTRLRESVSKTVVHVPVLKIKQLQCMSLWDCTSMFHRIKINFGSKVTELTI